MNDTFALLKKVKQTFPEGLSDADLIVLAGTVALQDAGVPVPVFVC